MAVTYEHDPELGIEELIDLYDSVGWSAYTADPDGLKRAVANSTYVVAAREGGELLGVARCISDDVSICHIQDILVRPTRQRSGIGRELFSQCTEHFGNVRMFVLMTDDEPRQQSFYASMGMQNLADTPTLRVFFTSNPPSG
ncbi:MAG: GNAT family N-acetyltransferase [Actinomycetota bacterium]